LSAILSFLQTIPTVILQVALICLLALVASWLARKLRINIEKHLLQRFDDSGQRARLKTLVGVSYTTLQAAIAVAASLMVLNALGINIGPLLAGVGIVGLAVSLGAQTLVKDFFGGFIILFENQFRVGDSIQVGTVSGEVEQITLRATILRDGQGRQYIIPNGDIRVLSNYTRDWAKAVVDLNVPFDSDVGQVVHVLEAAMEKVAADETVKADLMEPPQITGWNSFNEWSVQVRLSAKTRPGKHGGVERLMRQRALEALDNAGLKIAVRFPDIKNTATG
jgi:small-conductance mechanosensitive channel